MMALDVGPCTAVTAGLICVKCYAQITRADAKMRNAVQVPGGRVAHRQCPG